MNYKLFAGVLWLLIGVSKIYPETFVPPVAGPIRYSSTATGSGTPFDENIANTWYTMVWGGSYEAPVRGEGTGGHPGVDIRDRFGVLHDNLSIYAIGEGFIIKRRETDDWGRFIVIHHDRVANLDSIFSIYAHLASYSNRIQLSQEDTIFVKRGEIIGTMGSSGTDARHLHFQIDRMWLTNPNKPYWSPGYPRHDKFLSTEEIQRHFNNVQNNTINPMLLVENGSYTPLYHKEQNNSAIYRLQKFQNENRLCPIFIADVLFALTGIPNDFDMVEEHPENTLLNQYQKGPTIGHVGTLYRKEGEEDVWVITKTSEKPTDPNILGEKRHISSAAFSSANFSLDNVLVLKLDKYFLKKYETGALLDVADLSVFIGIKANGSTSLQSAFQTKYDEYGVNQLGYPFDNGGRIVVHEIEGIWIQDFKQTGSGGEYGETAIIFNPSLNQAFLVRTGFWAWYKGVYSDNPVENTLHQGFKILGPPEDDEITNADGTFQRFEKGVLEWDETSQKVIKHGPKFVNTMVDIPDGTGGPPPDEEEEPTGGEEPTEELEPSDGVQPPSDTSELTIESIWLDNIPNPFQLQSGKESTEVHIYTSVIGYENGNVIEIHFMVDGMPKNQKDGIRSPYLDIPLDQGTHKIEIEARYYEQSVRADTTLVILPSSDISGIADDFQIQDILSYSPERFYIWGASYHRLQENGKFGVVYGFDPRNFSAGPIETYYFTDRVMSFLPSGSEQLGMVAGTWGSVYHSLDGGITWQQAGCSELRSGAYVRSMVSYRGRSVYVGIWLQSSSGDPSNTKGSSPMVFIYDNNCRPVNLGNNLLTSMPIRGDVYIIGTIGGDITRQQVQNFPHIEYPVGKFSGKVGEILSLYKPKGYESLALAAGQYQNSNRAGIIISNNNGGGFDTDSPIEFQLNPGDKFVDFIQHPQQTASIFFITSYADVYVSKDAAKSWQKYINIHEELHLNTEQGERITHIETTNDNLVVVSGTQDQPSRINLIPVDILRRDEQPTATIKSVEPIASGDSLRVIFQTTGPGDLELSFNVNDTEIKRMRGITETAQGKMDTMIIIRPLGHGSMPVSLTAVSDLNLLSSAPGTFTATLPPRLPSFRLIEPILAQGEQLEVLLGDTLTLELAVESTDALRKLQHRFTVPTFVNVQPVPNDLTRFILTIIPPINATQENLEFKTVVFENGNLIQ